MVFYHAVSSREGTGTGPRFKANLFPPSSELGTFRVLGERDNHYTTETAALDSWVLRVSSIVYKSALHCEGKYANTERVKTLLLHKALEIPRYLIPTR